MRKVLVYFIAGFVLLGIFSAQHVNAQNADIEEVIIGEWIDTEGNTWIFDVNGNLSVSRYSTVYTFAVVDAKLSVSEGDSNFTTFNIYIRSNGQAISLDLSSVMHGADLNRSFYLTKK